MQEITKSWVFIPVRKENIKDFFLNFWQTGNLISRATRLLLKYKPNSYFVL